MPVTLTKAQIEKLLVEERKKSRVKQQQSAFMRRTLSIYNGQKTRFEEWKALEIERRKKGLSKENYILRTNLAYTLEQFRVVVRAALTAGTCCYCRGRLTVKNMAADHSDAIASGGAWTLANLNLCDQNCNWQKGKLSAREFRILLKCLGKYLSPESAADVKRRLSIGGKWSPR